MTMTVVNIPLHLLSAVFFSADSHNVRFSLLKKPSQTNGHNLPFPVPVSKIVISSLLLQIKMRIGELTVVINRSQAIRFLASMKLERFGIEKKSLALPYGR
jgi:hypothetical protein